MGDPVNDFLKDFEVPVEKTKATRARTGGYGAIGLDVAFGTKIRMSGALLKQKTSFTEQIISFGKSLPHNEYLSTRMITAVEEYRSQNPDLTLDRIKQITYADIKPITDKLGIKIKPDLILIPFIGYLIAVLTNDNSGITFYNPN